MSPNEELLVYKLSSGENWAVVPIGFKERILCFIKSDAQLEEILRIWRSGDIWASIKIRLLNYRKTYLLQQGENVSLIKTKLHGLPTKQQMLLVERVGTTRSYGYAVDIKKFPINIPKEKSAEIIGSVNEPKENKPPVLFILRTYQNKIPSKNLSAASALFHNWVFIQLGNGRVLWGELPRESVVKEIIETWRAGSIFFADSPLLPNDNEEDALTNLVGVCVVSSSDIIPLFWGSKLIGAELYTRASTQGIWENQGTILSYQLVPHQRPSILAFGKKKSTQQIIKPVIKKIKSKPSIKPWATTKQNNLTQNIFTTPLKVGENTATVDHGLDTKYHVNVSMPKRVEKNIREILSNSGGLSDDQYTLYTWQKQALKTWDEDHRKRGIVEAATGTGKTILACACMEKFFKDSPRGVVCIVVPRQPLFDQWDKELHKYFSNTPADNYCYIGNGHDNKIKRNTRFIVVMQQTMVLKEDQHYGCELLKMLRDPGSKRNVLIVFDEAHHLGAKQTLVRFVEKIPDEFFTLGLTATPDRTDGQMDEVYPKFDCTNSHGPIYNYSLAQAVEDKILTKVIQKNIKVSLNRKESKDYRYFCEKINETKNQIIYNSVFPVNKEKINQGDIAYLSYLQRVLDKRYSKGDWRILNLIKKISSLNTLYFKRRELYNKAEAKWEVLASLLSQQEWMKRFMIGRWIFFHQGIDECEKTAILLKRVLGDQNIKLHHSEIKKNERDKVLKDFNKNIFPCICAAQTLDEGIDIPDLRGIVIVSGSTTKRQQVQRCGRALRKAENKDCAYLVSLLAQLDDDTTGERLLISPEKSTNRWTIEDIDFPEAH